MAKALRIGQSRLRDIENLRTVPNDKLMKEIAALLDKPVDYLFPYTLLRAIEAGVFKVRKAELPPLHLSYLTDKVNASLLSDGGDGVREIEAAADRSLLRETIDEILQTFPPRERQVIEMRFGLKDGRTQTLEEVGVCLGVTRERIRQMEGKVLRKLRHPKRSRLQLSSFGL